MIPAKMVPFRFSRSELEQKAELSEAGRAALGNATKPAAFVETLVEQKHMNDAVGALAIMLPHRQSVWWACLCARLIPDLAQRERDLAAVETAERWVQGGGAGDAELAGDLADRCDRGKAPAWVAQAAFWAGPSLAPRGQQPVPPPPHLPGVATRAALLLLQWEPELEGKLGLADWMEIGQALMNGENGREAQAAVRQRMGPA